MASECFQPGNMEGERRAAHGARQNCTVVCLAGSIVSRVVCRVGSIVIRVVCWAGSEDRGLASDTVRKQLEIPDFYRKFTTCIKSGGKTKLMEAVL